MDLFTATGKYPDVTNDCFFPGHRWSVKLPPPKHARLLLLRMGLNYKVKDGYRHAILPVFRLQFVPKVTVQPGYKRLWFPVHV